MKFKFAAQLLVTMTLSGIMLSTAVGQAKSEQAGNQLMTTFYCGRAGDYFATFARRGERRTGPMIIWQSDAFGPEFPPRARCEQVSDRFTTVVATNGGSLRNLLLTTGRVNGQTVVCFVNTAEYCNNKNVLFTLKPENAGNSGDVLAKLLRFSQRASGRPVFESGGGTEENPAGGKVQQYVSLEEVVDKAFESGSNLKDNPNVAHPDNAPNK